MGSVSCCSPRSDVTAAPKSEQHQEGHPVSFFSQPAVRAAVAAGQRTIVTPLGGRAVLTSTNAVKKQGDSETVEPLKEVKESCELKDDSGGAAAYLTSPNISDVSGVASEASQATEVPTEGLQADEVSLVTADAPTTEVSTGGSTNPRIPRLDLSGMDSPPAQKRSINTPRSSPDWVSRLSKRPAAVVADAVATASPSIQTRSSRHEKDWIPPGRALRQNHRSAYL